MQNSSFSNSRYATAAIGKEKKEKIDSKKPDK